MRLPIALAAFALGAPSWSAQCSTSDTAAVMARINKYVLPSPESPKYRRMAWTTGNSDQERVLHEYSGLRILIACDYQTSKADGLNGIEMRGEINFKYEAARFMDFPEIMEGRVQSHEWSDWVEERETWNPGVIFRKYKGKIQLQREFVGRSYSDPIPADYVDHFFAEAETKAAELRAEEAERNRVEAAQMQKQQEFDDRVITRPNPADYYPNGLFGNDHSGKATIRICVDPAGRVRNVEITETSGFRKYDRAAVEYGRAFRFKPALATEIVEDMCRQLALSFEANR